MFMSNQICLISLIRTKTGFAFNTATRACKQGGTSKSESHTIGSSVPGSLAHLKELSSGEAEGQNESM